MRLLATVLAILLVAASAARAEKRVALVIGNAAYKNAATLQNPRNDAQDVVAALKRLNFETIVGVDLDKVGMEEKAISFSRAAHDADVALVYYSGHAMQRHGINYLMPVDAVLRDEADLRRLVRVDDIVADLSQAKNLRILVLDACRVNPLAEELSRAMELTRGPPVDRGLARIIAARGMIISYATQAGQTAADGLGRNSPYTMAFLKNIETTDEISTIFHHITADVDTATQSKQLPELSLSVVGDFYLKGRPEAVASVPPAVPLTQPTSEAERAWAEAKNASNPAILEAFIRRYGDSFYADLARARLEELKKSQIAVVAPPVAAIAPAVLAGPCGGDIVSVSFTARAPCPLSATEERSLESKDVFKECDVCPEMVVVPAGIFTMGSPSNEAGRDPDEGPQHRVSFSRPFAVGQFSVTFDEWDACVADSGCNNYKPSDEGWGRGRRPVINVTWDDAKSYVAWLSRKSGKPYRLLSESEREYVARAGTTTPFWWGSSISHSQANYNQDFIGGKTLPVDTYQANHWGLYQVHGNVWEWVEDCYHDTYSGAPTDGSAWTNRDCALRVCRGGSWYMEPRLLRAAERDSASSSRSSYIGFRVARTLAPER